MLALLATRNQFSHRPQRISWSYDLRIKFKANDNVKYRNCFRGLSTKTARTIPSQPRLTLSETQGVSLPSLLSEILISII